MVYKNLCILMLWIKVALVFEGLRTLHTCTAVMMLMTTMSTAVGEIMVLYLISQE